MSKENNVIVLAGTRWQIPLIKKIKEKGLDVIVFNLLKDSPAFAFADESCIVNILDKEACLELAKKYSPCAILSDECDIAVPTIAYLSEKLNLKSIGCEMADLYTNKYIMRCFAKEKGFDTPVFYKCDSIEEAIAAFRKFNCKMIMKPLDANSSRGVYSIESEDDIKKYFEESISFSKIEKSVLLEEYIEGTEFTVDGIKTECGHVSLAISEKKHYAHNENIANSLYFSHKNDCYDYALLKKINDDFVNSSGLSYGLTHAEYKCRDGKFYLIEIGARGGGNLISAEIVPLMSGIDNYDYLIDKTIGLNHNEKIEISNKVLQRCAVLKFFDTEGKEGCVKDILGEDYLEKSEKVVDYAIYCKPGDVILNAADDSKRIGYYIAYGENSKELDVVMQEIEESFHIVLEES